jgi:hypothetical protein
LPHDTFMSLIFWIVVGIALTGLLIGVIGLIVKARLDGTPVFQGLVHPDGALPASQSPNVSKPTEVEGTSTDMFREQTSKSHRGVAMIPSPTADVLPPGGGDLRRSSRVERSVPLLVVATNHRGETFKEKTSAVAVNLHGCRYSSRHDYAPETVVTLQVTGTDGASSSLVRARVRSVLSAQTSRELCQVGVELERPGNVWGIPSPPEDWHRVLGANQSSTEGGTGVGPAPSERRAEVTVFPGQTSQTSQTNGPAIVPPADAAEGATTKDLPANKPERVVVNPEQLLQALQGKLQAAADKAVQTALTGQLEDVVRSAVTKIEESWRGRLLLTEEYSTARLAEIQNRGEQELGIYRGRADEISRRIEELILKTQQALSETQQFVERFATEVTPQLQARLNNSAVQANSEFEARVAQVSEQHLAQLTESTQIATRQAHSQIDEKIAEVHALASTTPPGAGKDSLEQLVSASRKQTIESVEDRLRQFYVRSSEQYELAHDRADEIARQVEILAAETRQNQSRHEQYLAELRSLVAEVKSSAVVPQEQFDSQLDTSREKILSHLEGRLGEVSGKHEQLLGEARGRTVEVGERLELLYNEMRAELAALKELAERKVPAPDISAAIEQSLERATLEFETVAARVADRQLSRFMELKQSVAQEVSLELEARTSEARAVLQKIANGTVEEMRRRAEGQINIALVEATERATSSLTSLDAESRVAWEARYRALEGKVAGAAEQATLEFRSGIKTFLYSCLVAAVSAVDQHSQITLAGLGDDSKGLHRALGAVAATEPKAEDFPAPPEDLSASA